MADALAAGSARFPAKDEEGAVARAQAACERAPCRTRLGPPNAHPPQVLGLDNAGKTTILKKLADEDITSITPTKARAPARARVRARPPAADGGATGLQHQDSTDGWVQADGVGHWRAAQDPGVLEALLRRD